MKSKAQSRLMHGIASGSIAPKKGQPSKAVAQEFVSAPTPKKLPERVKPKQKGGK
jgi:hypothetical protein